MSELRQEIPKMSLGEIVKLLFKIGKVGKDVWDKLKDSESPRLKWRKDVIELLDEKDVEIFALKKAVAILTEKVSALEDKATENHDIYDQADMD